MLHVARTVDRDRVLERLREMARIGALDNGGVCRLALSAAETTARITLLRWAQALGCTSSIDPIGNLFMRWDPLRESRRPPILVGSHLDSQPVGGNFDGVLGVIAALECVELLASQPHTGMAPVEIAVWCNEEGARFTPTTMGSAVHAGHLDLGEALAVTGIDGETVGQALAASLQRLSAAGISPMPRGVGGSYAAYVELHIEQGPILQCEAASIGVVTDVQGLVQYRVRASGVAGHAGAVPMEGRADALARARALLDALDHALRGVPGLRYTIGRFDLIPGSINTIPSAAEFTLDIRHPDGDRLNDAMRRVETILAEVRSERLIYQAPVPFDPAIGALIAGAAEARGLRWRSMVSGATHDAAHIAAICPAGMIFVPCRDGVSHNENEFCSPDAVAEGTQVLADTVFALAQRHRP